MNGADPATLKHRSDALAFCDVIKSRRLARLHEGALSSEKGGEPPRYRSAVPSTKLTSAQIQHFLSIARKSASNESSDPEVIEEAANHAVSQLELSLDVVSTGNSERDGWVKVVARNHARKTGAKLHRELPMGRAGSRPPRMSDEAADERVALLIGELHVGAGSLGSLVADQIDFEMRWSLLSSETRALLHAKHVEGMSSKEMARDRGRGESAGTIDNKLSAARKAARIVFEDLLDQMQGDYGDEEDDSI